MRPFLDTNVLVYAASADRRQLRAEALLASGGTISVQAFAEFTHVLLNKQRRSWAELEASLADIMAVLHPPTTSTVGRQRIARPTISLASTTP